MKLKRFLRYLLSLLLIQSIIFSEHTARGLTAQSNTQNINSDYLLSLHRSLKSDFSDPEKFYSAAEKLVRITDEYLEDTKNTNDPNPKSRSALIRQHKALKNLSTIKNKLDICVKDPNNKLNFSQKIIDLNLGNYLSQSSNISPCDPSTTNELITDGKKIAEHIREEDFAKTLEKQILLNSALALTNYYYKFDPSFMKNGTFSEKELNLILNKICGENISLFNRGLNACSKVDKDFKNELKSTLKNTTKDFLGNTKKMNSKSATDSLNASIDRLNQSLKNAPLKRENGIYFDTPNLDSEDARFKFSQYTAQYLNELSHDAGILLITNKIKSKAGDLREFQEVDAEREKPKSDKFIFTPHQHVTTKDVNTSIRELKDTMTWQNVTNQRIMLKDYNKNTLNTLIKNNPLALGQTLIHNPEYLDLTCKKINEIHLEEVDEKIRDFGIVLLSSTALAALGGSIATSAITFFRTSYTVTRGTVLVGTQTGAAVGWLNGVQGASHTGLMGLYADVAYESVKKEMGLKGSFVTNNNDSDAIIKAQRALDKFKEARTNFIISLIIAGYTIPTAIHFLNPAIRSSLTDIQMSNRSFILNALATNAALARIKRIKDLLDVEDVETTTKRVREASAEQIETFIDSLSTLDKNQLNKIIPLFKDPSVSDEKIAQMIQAAKKK